MDLSDRLEGVMAAASATSTHAGQFGPIATDVDDRRRHSDPRESRPVDASGLVRKARSQATSRTWGSSPTTGPA